MTRRDVTVGLFLAVGVTCLVEPSWGYGVASGNNDHIGNRHAATMPVTSSGLYQLKPRYYSTDLKRFATADPIGLMGGANSYSYCANNPINFGDPSGLFTVGVGMSGSYNRMGAGGAAGFTVQFSFSQKSGFNAGLFGFSGGGAVVGPAGASLTFDFTVSGLKDVSDLRGTATELGIDGGLAGFAGGVAVAGPDVNKSGPQNLNTVSFGIGTPGGAGHLFTVKTRGITAQDFAQPAPDQSSAPFLYKGTQLVPSGPSQASVAPTSTRPNK